MTTDAMAEIARKASRTDPIVIAGPTASGKSALALAIAETSGGMIVNADALQVYANWRVLTARPDADDLTRAPHRLYGHIAHDAPYSVGHWLGEIAALPSFERLIIVGGTGLYLSALFDGLSDIPATPPQIRAEADARLAADGPTALLAEISPETARRIDARNPARIQRAWEVERATARPLHLWQQDRSPPLLERASTQCLLITAPPEILTPRIAARFDAMMAAGALSEARDNLARWTPSLPSMRAIGAPELIAYLGDDIPLEEARARAIIATRQYAKRQRTWFRARMSDWQVVPLGMGAVPPIG